MKRLGLALAIVVVLLSMSAASFALDGYCAYTKTTLSPQTVFVNGKEPFDLTALVKSICGFPIYHGVVCIFDAFKSLTFIDCEELNRWGQAYFTVHKGEYVNFTGSIPTQYIQARYYDISEIWDAATPEEERLYFFPSISNPGTLVCVGCAAGF